MREADCIFCKIANGEIPTRTVYEDEDFRVILDMSPLADGHALLMPKEHYKDVYDMPEELLGKAYIVAKRVADMMSKALGVDGFNILQNNGKAGGQTIFHFHIHLIPRYYVEGECINWIALEKTDEELDAALEKITSYKEDK